MTVSINAQHVTEEQALKKAQEFLNKKVSTQTSVKNRAPRKLRSLAKVSQSDCYYIFNAESNGGFVIVSGDERTEEILGYSTEGNINITDMPDNMRAWLKGYEEEILSIPANARASRRAIPKHPAVEPLITAQWSQAGPYNRQCPTQIPEGESEPAHCVTGCVATALAQIMYYWKWPQDYTTSIPAYDYGYVGWNEETQTDIFKYHADELPPTKFDWVNMKDTYNGSEIDVSADAVAQLMRYCGQAVNMNYGLYSSLAYETEKSIIDYFGYDPQAKKVNRDFYTAKEWDQIIYGEISSGRPVWYAGDELFLPGIWQGHCFVCDGYDGHGYYHFNWGWSGSSDGYFTLTGNESLSYVNHQDAVIGIQPPDGDDTENDMVKNVYVYHGIKYPNTLTLQFINTSDRDVMVSAYASFVGYNGTEYSTDIWFFSNETIKAGTAFVDSKKITSILPDGHYALRTAWREGNNNRWHKSSDISYVTIVGGIVEMHEDAHITANIDLSESNGLIGYWQDIAIHCSSPVAVNGRTLVLYASQTDDIGVEIGNMLLDLEGGESVTFNFQSFPLEKKGVWHLRLTDEWAKYMSDSPILAETDIEIVDPITTLEDISIEPYHRMDWNTKEYHLTILNTGNAVYNNPIGLKVCTNLDSYGLVKDYKLYKSIPVHIEPNSSVDVVIPLNDLDLDHFYSGFVSFAYNPKNDIMTSTITGWPEILHISHGNFVVSPDETHEYGYGGAGNKLFYYDIVDTNSKQVFLKNINSDASSIIIPSKVLSLEDGLIYSVKRIDSGALSFMSDIRQISISEGITTISIQACYNLKSLETITLPSTISEIQKGIIWECNNLKSIYIKCNIPPEGHGSDKFVYFEDEDKYSDITIYVPNGCREIYAKKWPQFRNIVEMDVEDMPLTNSPKGDVDWDFVVDVADLQRIINIIIGTMNATSTADVNGDGEIDIADIQNIINIILGNANAQSNVKSIVSMECTEATNDDFLGYKQACDKIDVGLSNKLNYSAFQMKVTLPEGVDIASVEFNKERLDGFTKLVKKIDEQQYLVMGYSMEGYIIEGDEGNLLTINTKGNGNVIISDVVFSTPDAISYQLRVIGDVETDVKDIAVTRVHSYGTTVYINIAYPQEMNVYSIGGQLVKKISLVSGLNSFTLPKGQYIINNQKVIIDK